MKQIANDEVRASVESMKDRTPTLVLRFYDIGNGKVILEQLWKSSYVGIDPTWVPVSCV